jgi:hypothetical protein
VPFANVAAADNDRREMTDTPGWSNDPSQPPSGEPRADAPPSDQPPSADQPTADSSPAGPPPVAPPPPPCAAAPGGPPYGEYPPEGEFRPQVDITNLPRHRRLTVFFRLLLLIPHFFVLYFVGIAAGVVAVIGWFGALFLGRLPGWAGEFLSGYVCWTTRVQASSMLLVDRYPDFGFAAHDGAIAVELRPGGRLNRLAVFFRFVLVIPAAIVETLLTLGWALAGFFLWLVVLVLGRNPRPVFESSAAVLRYQLRYQAYSYLLTSAYPKDIFGDGDAATAAAAGQPSSASAAGEGEPAEQPAGAEQPYAAPAVGAEAPVRTRPLLLSGGGKTLAIVFLALGVLYYLGAGLGGGLSAALSGPSPELANNQTVAAYNGYQSNVSAAAQRVSSCSSKSCVTGQFATIRDSARKFRGKVEGIDYPGSAHSDADSLKSDLGKVADAADQLTHIKTPQDFAAKVASTHIQEHLSAVGSDAQELVAGLRSSKE